MQTGIIRVIGIGPGSEGVEMSPKARKVFGSLRGHCGLFRLY